MSHPERRHHTGNYHFITFRCKVRNPYLCTPELKSEFVEILESRRQKYQLQIFGYVIMPEHVHLILNESPALSNAIGAIKREQSRRHPQSPFCCPAFTTSISTPTVPSASRS